jgi:TonB family protein
LEFSFTQNMNSTSLTKGCFVALAVLASMPNMIVAAPTPIIEEVQPSVSNRVMPRLISQTAAVYPGSAADQKGEVVIVSFVVDGEGKVREPKIVSSPAPQFEAPALKAVLGWRFTPGSREGRPADFHLKAPVNFAITTASVDSAPASLRKFDPVYPYEQLVQGREGWGEVSFVVDHAGRAILTAPLGSNENAFSKSMTAMIEAAEFTPARKDKRAVLASSVQRYYFTPQSSLDQVATEVLTELRHPSGRMLKVADLDERPRAVQQRSPVYPRALKSDGLTGQAEIEFTVDRDGRVLFPKIVSSSHEDFGWAAATAVAQWKFNRPMRNGQPVDVRMTVPILFDAQQLASAD